MCGRFTLASPADTVAELLGLREVPELTPRYNIAPTQDVAVVAFSAEHSAQLLSMMRWGLIPHWAKDPSIGSRMINARSETAAEKPTFKAAIRQRRCLIVADGFYEWQKIGSRKQPHYVRMRDGVPFAFAGLWERWKSSDGTCIDSCTILTAEPSDLVRPLHDRMPVILATKDYEFWLDPSVAKPEEVQPLLRPFESDEMIAYPVDAEVNSPRNDSPRCIKRLAELH